MSHLIAETTSEWEGFLIRTLSGEYLHISSVRWSFSSNSTTGAALQLKPRVTNRRSVHCCDHGNGLQTLWNAQGKRKIWRYVGESGGEVAYLQLDSPKWYDAACQSAGKALDITTPAQWRKHVSIKRVQGGDSLFFSEVTHSAKRPGFKSRTEWWEISSLSFWGRKRASRSPTQMWLCALQTKPMMGRNEDNKRITTRTNKNV